MAAPSPVDPERLRRELESICGARRVSMREVDLTTYARDMWPRLLLSIRAGVALPHRPHAVVWPESVREVAAVVRVARTLGVPIIPYGGGSGVCGGVVPLQGGITVDLKRLDRLHGVDGEEMIADVEGGINGERCERELERRGYTLGNFPSSIYCSTVGGWLATRAAGQLSTKYGKIEDRVAGVTMVTGRGEVIVTDGLARATRGPSWTQLALGSEGTFGLITSARLRVATAPQLRVMRGYEFASVAAGTEAIRAVLQRGLRPAVVRLYDEVDTLLNSFKSKHDPDADAFDPASHAPVPSPGEGALPTLPRRAEDRDDGVLVRLLGLMAPRTRQSGSVKRGLRQEALAALLGRAKLFNAVAGGVAERIARRGCKMIIGLEGARIRTEIEAALVFGELERAGGIDLGEEPGRDWLAHRYAVSYRMSPVFRDGAFVDTMEVASTWDRLMDLYRAVGDAIGKHAVVMAHFSHAYPEGCSIYFSFAGRGDDLAECQRVYDAIWHDGLTAASRVGGTISHHHGVGMLKAAFMNAEHREAMVLLGALKRVFDPDGVMNPGKLGLANVAPTPRVASIAAAAASAAVAASAEPDETTPGLREPDVREIDP